MAQNSRVEFLKSLKSHEQNTSDWHTKRNALYITGTSIAKILNDSKYGNSEEHFLEVTGRKAKKAVNSYFTEHGTYYESIALKKYQKKTGKKTFDVGCITYYDTQRRELSDRGEQGMVQEADLPDWTRFVGGSPDAITEDGILVEIKCPKARKPICSLSEIPTDYYHQIQFYLFITGLQLCHYVEYVPPSIYQNSKATTLEGTFNIWPITRDERWAQSSLLDMMSFVERCKDVMAKKISRRINQK